MSDFLTVNPDQLAGLGEVPANLKLLAFTPGGPLASLPYDRLLAKLIGTAFVVQTKPLLDADLDHPVNTVAMVYGDADPLANGWYRKTGVAGAGAWVQFEVLLMTLRHALQDAADRLGGIEGIVGGLQNFHETLAAAVAATAIGDYFGCTEVTALNPDGEIRIYRRVVTVPGYEDLGDKAAPVSRWSALTRHGASIYPVSDPIDLAGAVAAASAAGGGVVRIPRGANWAAPEPLVPGSRITIDVNGGRLRPAVPMATLIHVAGDDVGVVGGEISGDGKCSSYVIKGNGRSGGLIEDIELTGWKMGYMNVAAAPSELNPYYTDADIERLVVRGMKIHSPMATAQIETDHLVYPFWVGGGPNYRSVKAIDIDGLGVWGAGGNYQDWTGTADQIALQNCQGGRLVNFESHDGGENGVSVTRLCSGVLVGDGKVSGNNGLGLQIGSARVDLTVNDASGLVLGTVYIAVGSGARGIVDYISGNRVIMKPLPDYNEFFDEGVHLLFLPGDTFGGATVQTVTFGDGFTIGNIDATDNSRDAPGASAGIMLQYVRGRYTGFTGVLRCIDTRAVPQQSYPMMTVRSDNVGYPANVEFRGNITNAAAWFSTKNINQNGIVEWQVSDIVIPALAPGDSVPITFTGLPNAIASQWVQAVITGDIPPEGITRTPVVTGVNTLVLWLKNERDTYFAGIAAAIIRLSARTKSDALVNTVGGAASVGAVKKGPGGQRPMLAADFSVTNSVALVPTPLSKPVQAGKSYAYEAVLIVSAGVTPGFKFSAAWSETGTGGYTSNHAVGSAAETAMGTATVGTGSATRRIVKLMGYGTATVSGELRILFAQNVADAATITLHPTSWLELKPL